MLSLPVFKNKSTRVFGWCSLRMYFKELPVGNIWNKAVLHKKLVEGLFLNSSIVLAFPNALIPV